MSRKTVTSYILPTDAHIARAKLETEGLEVFLKDELTVQTDNFMSNAIGGVKVQVLEENYELAKEILIESHLLKEVKQTKSKNLTKFNDFTSKLPIIGKWIFEIRLLFIVGIILFILLALAFISFPESTNVKLIDEDWCTNQLNFDNEIYEFNTIDSNPFNIETTYYNYNENIIFLENGQVYFPGINCRMITANWEMKSGNLIIKNTDTLGYLFDGEYYIDVFPDYLRMISETTTIIGYPRKPLNVWYGK